MATGVQFMVKRGGEYVRYETSATENDALLGDEVVLDDGVERRVVRRRHEGPNGMRRLLVFLDEVVRHRSSM